MLDRKAILVLSILVLVMLVGDIWQVTHAAHWSMALFVPPVTMMIAAAVFVLKERVVVASADALAAWKQWGGFFLISCAAIVTVIQLLPVFRRSGMPLPSSVLNYRFLVAGFGVVVVVTGNRTPKLPPLQRRRPSVLSLGMAGQIAISRLAGWLGVSLGVTAIVSALFLPARPIAPVMGSLDLTMLVALLVKGLQLRETRHVG
jgi:hypothetical protein